MSSARDAQQSFAKGSGDQSAGESNGKRNDADKRRNLLIPSQLKIVSPESPEKMG